MVGHSSSRRASSYHAYLWASDGSELWGKITQLFCSYQHRLHSLTMYYSPICLLQRHPSPPPPKLSFPCSKSFPFDCTVLFANSFSLLSSVTTILSSDLELQVLESFFPPIGEQKLNIFNLMLFCCILRKGR